MSKPIAYYSYPEANTQHFDQLNNQFGPRLEQLDKDKKCMVLVIASQAVSNHQSFSQVATELKFKSHLPSEFCDHVNLLTEAGLLSLCDLLTKQLWWG